MSAALGDAFCAECGSLMVPTGAGHMCPLHDWHDECSLSQCGSEKTCGLREGMGYGLTPDTAAELA